MTLIFGTGKLLFLQALDFRTKSLSFGTVDNGSWRCWQAECAWYLWFQKKHRLRWRGAHAGAAPQIHIPHPLSWIYAGFARRVFKRSLAQPSRIIPELVSLPLPEVRTGMATLASPRAEDSGRALSSPTLAAPPRSVPSASGRPGSFGSCAGPRRLLIHSGAL
jgi:hypothetical protein